jgi:hypothetical protein
MNKNLIMAAIAGEEVPVINEVAKAEGVRPNILLKQVALGRVVIIQRDGKQPIGHRREPEDKDQCQHWDLSRSLNTGRRTCSICGKYRAVAIMGDCLK